jgi:hypothetical protein
MKRRMLSRRFQDETQGLLSCASRISTAADEEFHEFGRCSEAIKGVLSHVPVVHQPGLLELGQVVEIWLCPLDRISRSSATDSSSCSSSSRTRRRSDRPPAAGFQD